MLRRLSKLFGFESCLDQREQLRRRARPAVEFLEDRLVPSTISVNSTADNTNFNPATVTVAQVTAAGATVSLRDAINAANNSGGSNTIALPAGSTYDLTTADNATDGANGLPVITAPGVSIWGKGSTIERDTLAPAFRLFDVSSGASLTLQNLTLSNGLADGTGTAAEGGAILSSGTLTLNNDIVQDNQASGSRGFRRRLVHGGGEPPRSPMTPSRRIAPWAAPAARVAPASLEARAGVRSAAACTWRAGTPSSPGTPSRRIAPWAASAASAAREAP